MKTRFPGRAALAALAATIMLPGLVACDGNRAQSNSIGGMQALFELPPPRPSEFYVCHEHGCHEKTRVSLSDSEWRRVRALMLPPAADAAAERARIGEATALLETLTGIQAGTANDVGGTFSGIGRGRGQLDCEDEAANTTQYLVMLADDGLLRFHTPVGRLWRGNFFNGWPHTTAVIVETATARQWAIDTWFEDNGRPAHVVEADRWQAGWSPASKVGPQFGTPAR